MDIDGECARRAHAVGLRWELLSFLWERGGWSEESARYIALRTVPGTVILSGSSHWDSVDEKMPLREREMTDQPRFRNEVGRAANGVWRSR